MRTAQFLLAGAACVLLAACGTSTITSSDAAPPAALHRDGIDETTTTTSSECQGTLVVTVDASGNLVTQCVIEGRQTGGGN
jgi:outer membrane biogenesis lipoprotein LolB